MANRTQITHRLAATQVAGERPSRHLVMLHGIYGRGRNLRTVARKIVGARSEYACWLLDLPHHGESGPGRHGEGVLGFARDVADWLDAQALRPDAVLGHSYGGKVALALVRRASDPPRQVWVIDSTPDVKPPSGGAWEMLRVVRAGPSRFSSRDEAVRLVVDGGFPLGVARWMATNVVRDADGWVWRLDFDVMERLLHDFFVTDLWDVVEHPPGDAEMHFLKASESNAISREAVRRLEATSLDRVRLHHREGGHWIHAESPAVVAALLIEHLP